MAIIRIYPTQDTSIVSGDPATPMLSASLSNFGASEIMSLFRWDLDVAEMLLKFQQSEINAIPSGSDVLLHISDAQHSDTLPAGYTVVIRPIEQTWSEGGGVDIDTYLDIGAANYVYATTDTTWSLGSGSLGTGSLSSSFYFDSGFEDLVADISGLTGSMSFGLAVVMVTGNLYVKKFHSRQSHFLNKRPYIEARYTDWTGSLTTTQVFLVTSGAYVGTEWPSSMASSSASGSGTLVTHFVSDVDPTGSIVSSVYNLRQSYDRTENVRLRFAAQRKDWNIASPVTVVSSSIVLTNAFYRVNDTTTNQSVIQFGTGSLKHTKLSYDDDGNYFDFDMSNLIVGPLYEFDFIYESPTGSGNWSMLSGDQFKFRLTEVTDG